MVGTWGWFQILSLNNFVRIYRLYGCVCQLKMADSLDIDLYANELDQEFTTKVGTMDLM